MRNEGRLVLGFYPLPENEAKRLRLYLDFPDREFAALDPCVGDGAAFNALVDGTACHRYGIELDSLRAESATAKHIEVLHADALEVHCPPESISLLYLNPPYDFEVGSFRNRRFEELFLRHALRWLKAAGVLVFIIPRRRLTNCSALLAECFNSIRLYRLTSPECLQYHQIAVLASRRTTRQSQNDRQYRTAVNHLNDLAGEDADIPALGDVAEAHYRVPPSLPIALTNRGIPLDIVEDLLPTSAAYKQTGRLLLRQPSALRGRPITQLHGGHVALLAASGALNGVFGQGGDRHMANWSPAKMFHHSVEHEPGGTVISRKWSSYSPKLLLLYENGTTKVLTHSKLKRQAEDDGQHELPTKPNGGAKMESTRTAAAPKPRRTVRRHIHLPKS